MDTQVTLQTHLNQRAQAYFLDRLGVGLEAVLAPVDAALPAGRPVRGTGVYSTIEKARLRDDDSLPRGAWDRELKRAAWDTVTAVALDALRHKSKDLQLVGWLLEAQINQHGFSALAPCLLLLDAVCHRYWDTLHPLADDGDLEFRANIIRWMADKLLPTLRLLPLVGDGRDAHYCLADWETAMRNEQLRAALGKDNGEQLDGASAEQLQAALQGSRTDDCVALQEALSDALATIGLLMTTLDERFGAHGPSFGKMAGVLERILSLLDGELNRRGVAFAPVPATVAGDDIPAAAAATPSAAGPIRDREDAYARLAEAAGYLCRIEPHSPAPYLVKRAIEWGRMNTVDLYQELFIKLGGTLNIFELLGLRSGTHEDGK